MYTLVAPKTAAMENSSVRCDDAQQSISVGDYHIRRCKVNNRGIPKHEGVSLAITIDIRRTYTGLETLNIFDPSTPRLGLLDNQSE